MLCVPVIPHSCAYSGYKHVWIGPEVRFDLATAFCVRLKGVPEGKRCRDLENNR